MTGRVRCLRIVAHNKEEIHTCVQGDESHSFSLRPRPSGWAFSPSPERRCRARSAAVYLRSRSRRRCRHANKSCAKLAVPAAQPRAFANTKLGVRTRTTLSTANPNAGGKAATVTLLFDNDFSVTPGTIPNCAWRTWRARPSRRPMRRAVRRVRTPTCRRRTRSAAGRPPRRRPTSAAARWCSRARRPTKVILYARVTLTDNSVPTCTTPGGSSAGNTTVTLVGTIAHAGVAGYGKKLTVPGIAGLALPLDDFYATIQRGSYFRAKCPAGAYPWKLRAHSSTAVPATRPTHTTRRRRATSATGFLGPSRSGQGRSERGGQVPPLSHCGAPTPPSLALARRSATLRVAQRPSDAPLAFER